MAVITPLQKCVDYLTFKGNLNRKGFLLMIAIAELIYILIGDALFYYDRHAETLPVQHISLLTGLAFCYLYGIAIAARVRNMKFNPWVAYCFVFALWGIRFVALNRYMEPIYRRVELKFMLELFLLIPLFAKDKKSLLSEK